MASADRERWCERPSASVIASLEDEEAAALETSYTLFKGYVMYIDDKVPVALPGDAGAHRVLQASPLTVPAYQIRLHGGCVSDVLDTCVCGAVFLQYAVQTAGVSP